MFPIVQKAMQISRALNNLSVIDRWTHFSEGRKDRFDSMYI